MDDLICDVISTACQGEMVQYYTYSAASRHTHSN